MLELRLGGCEQSANSTSLASLLLAEVPIVDRASVGALMAPFHVDRGTVLVEPGSTADFVYFSQGPLISLNQGQRIEVALIGSEGVVGWPALAGCVHSPFGAVVCGREGWMLRTPTEALIALMSQYPSVGVLLNRFATVVGLQMAETISAHMSHRIEVRLARWLLLRHDRIDGDEMIAYHDEIADNLGTRRASITDCFHVMEGNGLLRCRRGRITMRDRLGVESLATGCYGLAEDQHRAIIGRANQTPSKTDEMIEAASSVSESIAAGSAASDRFAAAV